MTPAAPSADRPRSPAVDVHAHAVPATLLTELARGHERFPHIEVTPHGDTHVVSFDGGAPTRPIAAGLLDPARRSEWRRQQRVDYQVMAGWLDLFGYQLPPAEGAAWATLLTERLAELARAEDGSIALGTVPLQDPVRAADALRAQHESGLRGIMIATRAGERELDDPEFTPLWQAADHLRAVVFLHPGFAGSGPRYAKFGLLNGLGRIEDSTVALARLLYAGIPARFPGMRLLVAHGGGALPYVLGRLVRNHVISGDALADPLESFARLYFDSVVFDPPALRLLIDRAGANRILLGSDYPFPIGDLAPRHVIDTTVPDTAARDLITGQTAAELFGTIGTRVEATP